MFNLILRPFLIAAAVIPAIALLLFVYRSDRLERESPRLLAVLVVEGIIATALAAFTEEIGEVILGWFFSEDDLLYWILFMFGVVGLSEEGFKYLFLKRRTWNNPEFNCQYDGVVYAVFVSLGFALWENIRYVIMYGFGTAVLRAVTAVPGHASFAVFMGAWYGAARRLELAGDHKKSRLYRKIGLVSAIFLHGFYDFAAIVEIPHFEWLFLAFIAVLFGAAILVVRHLSKSDRYMGRRFFF